MAEEGRYRLAPLRDARERDERSKRGDLAVAVWDAEEAKSRLDAARARTTQAREALTVAIAARDKVAAFSATPARLSGAEQFIARRRRELENAVGEEVRLEAALDERKAGVDVARRTLARARADRQVIERHFERWRNQRQLQAERRRDE